MYNTWFKFSRLPFRLRPDPDFLYLPPPLAGQYADWVASARQGSGTYAIVGPTGCGKTTLLTSLALELSDSARVIQLRQPELTPAELMSALCEQFGLPASAESGQETAGKELRRQLAQERGMGRQVLFLVDDAHRMPAETLKLLLRVAAHRPAPVLILAGTPAMLPQLRSGNPGEATVELRGIMRLGRFEPPDTRAYIQLRLQKSGGGERLFDPDVTAEIQRYTGGTPPMINRLCDSALTLAAERSGAAVSLNDIRDSARDLKWVEFSARPEDPDPGAAPTLAAANSDELHSDDAAINAELLVEQAGQPVNVLSLKPGKVIIGRGDHCDVHLEGHFVSRQHCQIVTTPTHSYVEDLGSTNGVLVNGKRRRVHRLSSGDRIALGDHILHYGERRVTADGADTGKTVAIPHD